MTSSRFTRTDTDRDDQKVSDRLLFIWENIKLIKFSGSTSREGKRRKCKRAIHQFLVS